MKKVCSEKTKEFYWKEILSTNHLYRRYSLITTYDNGKYTGHEKRETKESGEDEGRKRSTKDEYEKSETSE